ncbi:hypothetical protein [Brevibacterium gallinarum]|uniref:Adenylosuccinate synthase n=1 Tax=Brevibacterium gallinarum TaxID=2762220 RepID=A0ABR8WQK4_9MICO|nr:hypothetical protein [Brevibacterium gallinarum]MBD8019360.1 hypothetical protein [Brevibacterium gallinarum]
MTSNGKLTAGAMVDMLRRHYIPESSKPYIRPGGVFAAEVGMNGSWGGPGSRRCDALYAGFTSASGRILIGHEVKISRSDWRAELAQTDKADAWADACHAWYIVAPSTDVVPVEELPEGWGLMLPPARKNGKRMTIKVKAHVKSDEHAPAWWAVRSLMARLDTLAYEELIERVDRITDAQRKRLEEHYRRDTEHDRLTYQERNRLAALAELEELLGCELTGYDYNRGVSARTARETLERIKTEQRALDKLQSVKRQLEMCRTDIDRTLTNITEDTP